MSSKKPSRNLDYKIKNWEDSLPRYRRRSKRTETDTSRSRFLLQLRYGSLDSRTSTDEAENDKRRSQKTDEDLDRRHTKSGYWKKLRAAAATEYGRRWRIARRVLWKTENYEESRRATSDVKRQWWWPRATLTGRGDEGSKRTAVPVQNRDEKNPDREESARL